MSELMGKNRNNQELLRQQCEIRQSVKNREDLLQQYNEIHLDNFKLSKSCMIDRYYTQLYAADTNGCVGNDMYAPCVELPSSSICMHSNTICIVSLAFGHEILTKGKKCVKVVFGVCLCRCREGIAKPRSSQSAGQRGPGEAEEGRHLGGRVDHSLRDHMRRWIGVPDSELHPSETRRSQQPSFGGAQPSERESARASFR